MGQFSSHNKVGNKQVVHAGKGAPIQAKLEVNQPGDQYEQEADAMAEKVMAAENDLKKTAVPTTGLIGKSFQPSTDKTAAGSHGPRIMRKGETDNNHLSVSNSFVTALDSVSGGSPLPDSTRATMEQLFGADFSGVRIFADEQAADLSKSIQARAFTYNNKILFNKGAYSTDTPEGKRLLAHELTHVLQQRNGLHLIQRDELVLPPIETSRQVWAQFEEAQRNFRRDEALRLAVRLAGMHIDLDDLNRFGLELSVYLMRNGRMTEGLQVLQRCEDFFWIRYVSIHPSPHEFMESYYIDQVREEGVQAARRQDWPTAFSILGIVVLYDQMELSFENSRNQPSSDEDLRHRMEGISPDITPRERRREMEGIFYLGQLGASLRSVFGYSAMGSVYASLRQDLTTFLRLQREAILAGNATLATEMGNQHTNFMAFLRTNNLLLSGEGLTMYSAESFNERGSVGYVIYGNNGEQEVVTPLPGTATPSELGFFPHYHSSFERIVNDMEGQAQLLNDLLAIPAIRAAFPTGVIDMTSLDTRIRIWQMVYAHHYTGSNSGAALTSTIRTIERYLHHFTVHTEYNIRDFGRSYLDTNFPTDLLGRSVRDCGVYALTTAYEIFRMGRGATPRLNLSFKLVSMPEHVTLLIENQDDNTHYLVNNDAITGPNTGDWMTTVAQAYSGVFSRGFGITPSVAIDLGTTGDADRSFRSGAWERYQASASWGFQTEPVSGPGDTRSEEERGRDAYVHYYERTQDFDRGCQRLVGVMNALNTRVQAAAAGDRQALLNATLNDATVAANVNALGIIYRFYGPSAASSGIIVADAMASARVRRHITGSIYLYSMPSGTTVHPLVRYAMAVLLLESLGTARTANQNALITALNATPDFSRQLTTYTTNRFPVQFKQFRDTVSDVHEQEADAMAAQVVGGGTVAAQPVTPLSGSKSQQLSTPAPSLSGDQQMAAPSGGSALDATTQANMEGFFNADLSGVKVHSGAEAAGLNDQWNARAFTTGQDIYFNAGQYNPHSHAGKQLLAHELTHVVQQSSAGVGNAGIVQRKPNPLYFETTGIDKLEMWVSDAVTDRRETYNKSQHTGEGRLVIETSKEKIDMEGKYYFVGAVNSDLEDGKSFPLGFYEGGGGWMFYDSSDKTTPAPDMFGFIFVPKDSSNEKYMEELKKYVNKMDSLDEDKNPLNISIVYRQIRIKQEEKKEAPTPVAPKTPPKPAPTNWGGITKWFSEVQQLVKGNGRTAGSYTGKFEATQITLPEDSVPDELQFIKDNENREIIQVRENGYNSWILATEFKGYLDDTQKGAAADFYYDRIISTAQSLAKRNPDDPNDPTHTLVTDYDSLTSSLESEDGKPIKYQLPALPAEIIAEEQQPLNGTGVLAMKIKWEYVSNHPLGQITEAMAKKDYRWEIWDITDLYERQSEIGGKEGKEAIKKAQEDIETGPMAGSGTEGTVSEKMDHTGGDFQRALDELKQRKKDINADEEKAIKEGRLLDIVSNELNKQLYGLDALFTLGKVALGAGADFVGDDEERSVNWTRKGVYIVRCIARIKTDKDEVIRVPSVATKIIKVQDTAEISREALDKPAKQLEDLQFSLMFLEAMPPNQTDQEQLKLLRDKVKSLGYYVAGDYEGLLKFNKELLQEKKKKLEKDYAYMLQFDIGKGIIWEVDNQIEKVDKQLKLLEERNKGRTLYSAEAVLVSSVTGQQYPLIIQISEPVSKAMKYHCYLSDITTDKGGQYEMYASTENDALDDVLTKFSSDLAAEYGGGVLSIRLPKKGWFESNLTDEERVKQIQIRTHDWTTAKMNLERLAETIAMIGLVVTNPALVVVGAALTAGLAADRIAKRISDGTFEWDSQVIGDMVQILLSATMFLGKAAGQIQAIGNRLRYFEKYGKFFLLTEAQLKKIKDIATVSEDVLNALSEVHGNVSMLQEFANMQEQVKLGNMNQTDARKKMAGMMGSVMQNLGGKLKQHYSSGGGHEATSGGEDNTNPAKKRGPYSETEFQGLQDVLGNAAKTKEAGLLYTPDLVHNPELKGNEARARYHDNMLVLEVGPNVTPQIVEGHLKTLATLQKYEGVIGNVRKLIDYVNFIVTGKGAGKYGSEHFVATNEISKLQDMITALRALQSRMEAGLTEAANNPDPEKINNDIAEYEKQIAEHSQKLGSLKPARDFSIASGNTMVKGSSPASPLKKSDAEFYTDPRIGETRYYEDDAGRISRTTRISENIFEIQAMLHPDQGIRADYQAYYSSKGLNEPGMELAHGLGPISGVESPQAIANTAIAVNQKVQKEILEGHIDSLRKNQDPNAQMRLVVRIERVEIGGKPYLKSVKYEVFASKPGVQEQTIFHAEVTIKDPTNKTPDASDIEVDIRPTGHPDEFLQDQSTATKSAKPVRNSSARKDSLDPDKAREYVAQVELLIQDLKKVNSSSHNRDIALFWAKALQEDLVGLHASDRQKRINNLTRDRILNFNETIESIFYNLPELRTLPNRKYNDTFNSKKIDEFIQ
ncbi:MAG: DUF4157 domain-containing protein [Niastella sp.]|nr:DUF4157 domain-containing protein [Niastella sp.]